MASGKPPTTGGFPHFWEEILEKPHLPEGKSWPQPTVEWFEAWRASERTDDWDAVQWQYMFDTAVVHALIYADGQFQHLGELRKRLAFAGLTFEPAKPKVEVRITPFEEIAAAYKEGHAARVSGA